MTSSHASGLGGLLARLRFPRESGLGLAAVVLFVVGDGIEAVWITEFLHSHSGYTVSQASAVYTCYGVIVALAAFLSGALCDAIGPRRVMTVGLVAFLVFDAAFILLGLTQGSLVLLMILYGMRGFGYPMLAYGFLTWMMLITPRERQSSSSGWFWFAFSLGMQTIGAWASSMLLPNFGGIVTLWVGWVIAALGGVGVLVFLRGAPKANETQGLSILASVSSGVSVVWRRPKVGIGGIIKIINLSGQYGLQAFYLVYIQRVHGMDQTLAITEFTLFGVVCILGDVAWGIGGDRLGWHRTLQMFATPLCAISLLYLYAIPFLVGPNFLLIAIGMAGMGIGLSAHVPTTPLIMAHAEPETANALAVLNLGAGMGAFVGPAVVTIFVDSLGYGAVACALAGLYVISFCLLFVMKHDADPREVRRRIRSTHA
ncbi:MFS transporter [Nanchangia anserum]|uniref:MFS transporter n=1 Tax=Nanchangia anserum TaxID=2692125 RepID=A0A8I0KPW0_9ACTO|nr:RbtT/DalT/CsbX family MFS transporter [Nanchangia anserum]MBD3689315.1 MFS transporter [Nanchangia anserum]QOX81529.1 MFS transporter [Nanchangia anserum]